MSASKTIRQAIAALRVSNSYSRYSNVRAQIQLDLEQLGDAYGYDADGTWIVARTRFHGGGILSMHRSPLAAVKAVQGYKSSDCSCGCAGVTLGDDLPGTETNDGNGYSPYALTR